MRVQRGRRRQRQRKGSEEGLEVLLHAHRRVVGLHGGNPHPGSLRQVRRSN